ncbi:EAL and HDOD domain-containing protein [Psychromonas sp. PT13]|uniref:EAL and HDOD domain-containing protein n=1 Tax=Psychromonas sp. PT13 TaxID=3439547 RepID=UPI003EB8C1A4
MFSYVARQPIVDRNKKTVAFELLYRDGNDNSFPNVSPDFATKSILMNQFLFHQKRILDGKIGYVNFGYESLIERLPFDFPNRSYTIEILEDCPPTDALFKIVVELKKKGYTVALDDFVPSKEWSRFYKYIDIIKFDILNYPLSKAAQDLTFLSQYDIKFLAEKVEDYAQFNEAKACGFHYFQGYFFSKPEVLHTKAIDPSLNAKIQLSAAISKETLDIDEIEKIVASNPGLSFKLLNFVNESSQIKSPIKSLQQALVYLGEDRIRKFVTYVVIKTLNPNKPGILFNMSLQRAKFFELILESMGLKKQKSLGYLCGMLTLIDALLDVEMVSVISPLNLNSDIKLALLEQKGVLGNIMKLLNVVEVSNWQHADELLEQLNIDETVIINAYAESIIWADSVMG